LCASARNRDAVYDIYCWLKAGQKRGYLSCGLSCADGAGVPTMIVSTTNDISGYKVVRHLGVVRGITVRSRSVVGNFVGGLQSVFGGKLSVYVTLAETARQEAFDHMVEHAGQGGANAIIGMRYDANEIMDGITEVLAYGTAVFVEPV
jgi:uncharacterized protein YbjQ (UPF0145 family)